MAIKKRPAKPPETHATRWAGFDGFAGQPKSKATIDCSNIEPLLRKAIENDADEVVLRIAQYGPSLEPANFQALVRFSDRTRAWAVCVHEDPYQALSQALRDAAGMKGPTLRERSNKSDTSASKDSAGSLRGGSERVIKRTPGKVRRKP